MSVDHKSTIDANKTDLLVVLRVSELLLTELCGEDVLDQRTKQEILAGGIQYEINGRFLDWLKQSQPSTFTVCLEKLRVDQQNHIANLLDGTPGERPLTREKRQQIQKNIRNLSAVIDVDSGLLVLLYSKGVISTIEHQELSSEKVKQMKAMKLLQAILQKSDRTLKCVVDALRETNQGHVISTLETGNIIAVHAEIRSASDFIGQFEEDLINILEPVAQQVSYLDNEEDQGEEVQPIIQELQEIWHKRIKILSLKKGKSITIYLWCEGVEAMAELFLMFETRHLEHILENIFNLVKTSVKILNLIIRVTLAANDLQILKEAVQLNELAKNKPELAEKDSFPEFREGEELQPPSFQIKTETKAEMDMSKVELPMTKQVSVPEETEPEIKRPELQLNVALVAAENIRLKEKLKAVEQEKSKLKQQLQLMQTENTVLKKQFENAKTERNQIQDRYDEVLQEKIKQQQRPQLASVILKHIHMEDYAVFGVAYLRDNIYLLSTQHILAYERDSPYRRNILKDISIVEIKGAEDIAACHRTSSLYVIDQQTSCVWQIIVDEPKPSKWLLEVNEPFSLSVTKDGRVLIPRSKPEPCLDVYNSRAVLLNHFLLPGKSWQPLHAVETMNGNFILSFCSGEIMNENGICELNGKGEVLHRPVYNTVGLESPVYMAPGNDNWVFVAREYKHSVTIFEKQFSCDIITIKKDGIVYPRRLCYIRGKPGDCARLVIIYGEKSEVAICTLPNAWHCILKNWQIH